MSSNFSFIVIIMLSGKWHYLNYVSHFLFAARARAGRDVQARSLSLLSRSSRWLLLRGSVVCANELG